MVDKAIALIDADCFYVSAERLRNAELIGRPVAVLGNHGHCVIARSYEMREAGVKTGMAIWEAKRLCPDGIYLDRDFRWYEIVSRSMLQVLREMFDAVEYYSVDEFYAEIEAFEGKSFAETAQAIRDTLHERTGVPVSVGIARTKTLAKMVCSASKPFGSSAVVGREAELNFLVGQPIAAIPGIGSRRQLVLSARGIDTAYRFIKMSRRTVRDVLTVVGEEIWTELQGNRVYDVRVEQKRPKSFSRGGSLGFRTSNPWVVYAFLERHIDRIVEELELHSLVAGRVAVAIDATERSYSDRATLPQQTALAELLLLTAKSCVRECWEDKPEVRRIWVSVDKLAPEAAAQRSLFDQPDSGMLVRAALRRRARELFGRDSIRSGLSLWLPKSANDPQQSFQLSDIRGKTVF